MYLLLLLVHNSLEITLQMKLLLGPLISGFQFLLNLSS